MTPEHAGPAAMTDPAGHPGRRLIRLTLLGVVSGGLTGVAGAAFRECLAAADTARGVMLDWAHQWPWVGWGAPVILGAVLVGLAAWLVQRFAPLAAGSGVQHVEAVMRGEADPAPFAVLPVKFVGGVLAIGSGLALGREGPTVQMGATIGAWIARRAKLVVEDIRLLQSATAGAGLGVAFNTPLGGIAFVFEELARRFSIDLMVVTLSACLTATVVAHALIGNAYDFVVAPIPEPACGAIVASLVLGALLGVLGAGYNRTIVATLDRFAVLTAPVPARAAFVGGVVGLLAWFEPRIVGGGDPLIQAVLGGPVSPVLLVSVLVLRWLLGPFSYAARTPGGLFAPLLVIGAVSGALFAELTGSLVPGLDFSPTLGAIVGMAAFFTAVVRSPFTGALLVMGMTGALSPLLPVLAASIAATIAPETLGSAPIYDTLRERMEHPAPPATRPTPRPRTG